jgi:WD40 repeat protein
MPSVFICVYLWLVLVLLIEPGSLAMKSFAAVALSLVALVGFGAQISAQEPKLRSTLRSEAGEVQSLVFSPDGKTLVWASQAKTLPCPGEIVTWDVASSKKTVLLAQADHADSYLAFARDGTLAAGGGPEGIRIWDLKTGKVKQTFKGQKTGFLAFSPDGKLLAAGGMKEPTIEDQVILRTDQVKLLDVAARKSKANLEEGKIGGVGVVAFSPDGKTLATSVLSFSPEISLWDVATFKRKSSLRVKKVITCLAYSSDGKTLATGDEEGTIKLWNVSDAKVRVRLTRHDGWVNSVQFSPDDKTLLSGSRDATVRLWDVGTGKELAVLRSHEEEVRAVAFSPDGRLLASGGDDKTVKVWNLGPKERKP